MQIKTTIIAAVFTAMSAIPVEAANNGLIQGWKNGGCSGDTRVILAGYSGFFSTCINSYSGSVKVTGTGCQTYYYSDNNCKTLLFNGAVPDSNCYNNVGSFVLWCQ